MGPSLFFSSLSLFFFPFFLSGKNVGRRPVRGQGKNVLPQVVKSGGLLLSLSSFPFPPSANTICLTRKTGRRPTLIKAIMDLQSIKSGSPLSLPSSLFSLLPSPVPLAPFGPKK